MFCREHNEYYNEYDSPCAGCDIKEFLDESYENLLAGVEILNGVLNGIFQKEELFYEVKELNEIQAFVNTIKDKIDSAFALELTEAIVRKHGKL
uniref:Uncharacterized protein n=1 Tax=viral metagenome TaxID=1070528 RepID=A0A6H1ZRY2_9ZZZZ